MEFISEKFNLELIKILSLLAAKIGGENIFNCLEIVKLGNAPKSI